MKEVASNQPPMTNQLNCDKDHESLMITKEKKKLIKEILEKKYTINDQSQVGKNLDQSI